MYDLLLTFGLLLGVAGLSYTLFTMKSHRLPTGRTTRAETLSPEGVEIYAQNLVQTYLSYRQ